MSVTIDHDAPPLRIDDTGTIRVGGSRLTLDIVIGAHLLGSSPEQIAEDYPAITLADVYATIGYYLRHRAAIDDYLKKRNEEAAELQRQIESQPGYHELRERILQRARERGLL